MQIQHIDALSNSQSVSQPSNQGPNMDTVWLPRAMQEENPGNMLNDVLVIFSTQNRHSIPHSKVDHCLETMEKQQHHHQQIMGFSTQGDSQWVGHIP